jgi:hypothetical protein
MKAKITKKDGTIIELEGTAIELRPFIEHEQPPKLTITGQATDDIGKLLEELRKGQKKQESLPGCPGIMPRPWIAPEITWGADCPAGGYHDFPAMWMSTSPPTCSKCHQPALQRVESSIVKNLCDSVVTTTAARPEVLAGIRVIEPQS